MSESDHSAVEDMDQEAVLQTQAIMGDDDDDDDDARVQSPSSEEGSSWSLSSEGVTQGPQPCHSNEESDKGDDDDDDDDDEEGESSPTTDTIANENQSVSDRDDDDDDDDDDDMSDANKGAPTPLSHNSSNKKTKRHKSPKKVVTTSKNNYPDESTKVEGVWTKAHGRAFNSRLFRIHALTLTENTGITFKKSFYVPKIHGLQMSHYFRALMRSIFREKLSKTVAYLSNSRQRREKGSVVTGNSPPKSLARNFKIKRESTTGRRVVLWNKSVVDAVRRSQTNINVSEVAEGLRRGEYVKDYFKGTVIPVGKSTAGNLFQLTQKELKSRNRMLSTTSEIP